MITWAGVSAGEGTGTSARARADQSSKHEVRYSTRTGKISAGLLERYYARSCCQAKLATKLELYDGATKVGELTKGPAEFTVKDLKPGYHAFSVLGTDGKGTIRPSNPVLVVVRR
jgi:hypothetical protein